MSKVLMRTIEWWRTDTEEEAMEIINEAAQSGGDLTKKTIELKTKKSKGVVIDSNFKTTVQVDFAPQFDLIGDLQVRDDI